MAQKKLVISSIIYILLLICFICKIALSNPNIDQWQDSSKSYKDLIEEGFEVKAYSVNTIETATGFKLLLFVTVLQKNNEIFECQEYQTLDESLETLDMSLVCRKLVQPYERGIGT